MEAWVCKYEIRDDGVYLNGEKIGERDANDLVERFDHEQKLFIGAEPRPRLFQKLRKLLDNT